MTADEARAEVEQIKQKLRDPKCSLFGSRKLYHRLLELYDIIDKEEALADSRSTRP